MTRVVFAKSSDGDWVGMYVDGFLSIEGHSLDERDVLSALEIPFETHEFYYGEPDDGKENPFYEEGRFPFSLADLKAWMGTEAYRGRW